MRFTPVALTAVFALATLASGTNAQTGAGGRAVNPRSAELVRLGDAAQSAGRMQEAIGLYESAAAVDPSNPQPFRKLAERAVADGLQGKAIGFYGQILEIDPADRDALSRQGRAMMAKGASEKARENLVRLRKVCTGGCTEANQLEAAIAAGPPPANVAAELIGRRPLSAKDAASEGGADKDMTISPVTGAPKPATPPTDVPPPPSTTPPKN